MVKQYEPGDPEPSLAGVLVAVPILLAVLMVLGIILVWG